MAKMLVQEMSEILLPMFSCRIFMVLQLNFFICFEFILVHGISQWSSFFFVCTCPIFPMTIIEEIVFTVRCCILCQMLIDHEGMGLFLGSLFYSVDLYACSYTHTRLFVCLFLFCFFLDFFFMYFKREEKGGKKRGRKTSM